MWIPPPKKSRQEEEPQSPLEFHPRSNGEYEPWDPTPREIYSDRLFHRLAADKARKLGLSRRKFIESCCGMATALTVLNQVMGCKVYDVNEDHTMDAGLAKAALAPGDQFIFDGHTHPRFLGDITRYVSDLFIGSATTMSVITVGQGGGTGPEDDQGWAQHVAIRELVNKISGGKRVVIQGKVWPTVNGTTLLQQQLDLMESMAKVWKVAAWKLYPHEARNWTLDSEDIGIPLIERGRALGVKIFAVHKGLGPSSPVDMPVVAKKYPDCKFLVFHAGVDSNYTESAYQPDNTRGLDRLISSWERNGKPDNVYADLGAIWSSYSRMNATAAGHMIGKLVKHLGEDKVCWGTDAFVLGPPNSQISSFNAFQIPQELQDEFQYPALTRPIKDKILGQNLAKVYGIDPAAALKAVTEDELAKMRTLVDAGEIPYRLPTGYGPRTRREFFAMLKDPSHPARA